MATIPKEQQTAFQRWEMTSFGDHRPSTLAARDAEQHAQEAARAQQLLEQRMQEALLEHERQLAEVGPPPPPPPAYPSVEEVEAIREQARLEGYEEGHAAGHADALALGKIESAKELEHLRALTASFGTAVQQADQLIANDVLELALQLAKGMLKTALNVKPELVLPIVRDAIEYLPVLQQPALLVLHPDDAAVVREGIGEELDKGGWRVIEDPSVGRGGCKVDTASNQIDAQAASRWQRLTHALGKDVDWLA
ncbi:flagellar assembly protein FliH [Duganella sp. LX20W]|uniref:Flagellar assembly protein FliH n=1 Tax=Rugamonas brunnea TaxID=2758569 RepID=A0A7W2IDY4_9BURK|nr:flagellar assembly protein FliH [Rugamonas brunnea]MBA5639750.1 flagellar assembly protein FliH [Rugamonas brunnea]